jgi:hypothetical protein
MRYGEGEAVKRRKWRCNRVGIEEKELTGRSGRKWVSRRPQYLVFRRLSKYLGFEYGLRMEESGKPSRFRRRLCVLKRERKR